MENITPTLILLWDVKRSLEKGMSVSHGIKVFLERSSTHSFSGTVKQWFLHFQTEKISLNTQHLPPSRRYLLVLLEHGLRGQSILEALRSFENELIISCEDEIQSHVAKLPLILLIPLMGLIFPSLMILIIGPMLKILQIQ